MDEHVQKVIDEIQKLDDMFQKAEKLLDLKIHNKIRVKDLAEATDMKPSYLCHILRLIKLPHMLRDGYYNKTVSLSHLFIIARLRTHEEMIRVYEDVLANNLTASATEDRVRNVLFKILPGGNYINSGKVRELQETLQNGGIDCTVKLTQTRIRSKLILEVKGSLTETTPAIQALLHKLSD